MLLAGKILTCTHSTMPGERSQTAGIDPTELGAMLRAGFSATEVVAAATAIPAQYWGLHGLGTLDVGKDASFLATKTSPLVYLSNSLRAGEPTVFNKGLKVRGCRCCACCGGRCACSRCDSVTGTIVCTSVRCPPTEVWCLFLNIPFRGVGT